jgi:nucleotide-binding universal stress UspA family protein
VNREKTHTETEPHSSDADESAPPTILVPLDGPAQATDLLPVAHGLAKLIQATIHIVHVSSRALPARAIYDKLGLTSEDHSVTVIDQRTGQPESVIIAEAKKRESRFIVMYAHSGSEEPEGGFGVIAREILLHAPCPIVLVPAGRGQLPWSLRRLLVPHDGTPASAGSIGPAGDLCHRARGEMTILHVASAAASLPEDPGTFNAPHYVDQPQHEWPAWGTEFLDRACAIGRPHCNVKLRTVLCTENVGAATVRFASDNKSDLIALSWRMRLEPNRALTLRRIVQQASCPVAIYPLGSKASREAPSISQRSTA